MDDGLELAQYTMIDFRHGTKVDPVVLNSNKKTYLFRSWRWRTGSDQLHFFILSFNGQLDSTFFRSWLVTFDGVVTGKHAVIPIFRTLHYDECKQDKIYLPIKARVYCGHFKMVDIRYIMMCYVNDIFRFTFPSTSLWWVPGSPSGWWRLRKAKRLLPGGPKDFKSVQQSFHKDARISYPCTKTANKWPRSWGCWLWTNLAVIWLGLC